MANTKARMAITAEFHPQSPKTLAIIRAVIAPIMYTRAIHLIGAPRAALMMVLVPVLTPLLGWLFLSEIPGWLTLAGMLLVLPGMVLAGGVFDALRRQRRRG